MELESKNQPDKPFHAQITCPPGEIERIAQYVRSATGAKLTLFLRGCAPDGSAIYLTDPLRPIDSGTAYFFRLFGAQVETAKPEIVEQLSAFLLDSANIELCEFSSQTEKSAA